MNSFLPLHPILDHIKLGQCFALALLLDITSLVPNPDKGGGWHQEGHIWREKLCCSHLNGISFLRSVLFFFA